MISCRSLVRVCEISTKELARHIMAERGLNSADTGLLQLFTRRTGALLRHQKSAGILRSAKDLQHPVRHVGDRRLGVCRYDSLRIL